MRTRLSILFFVLMLIVGAGQVTAQADTETIHLDFDGDGAQLFGADGKPFPIPPNDETTWHELWPNRCVLHRQTGYSDNDKDGCLSWCDNIELNGQWYHIRWVGYTLFCEDGSYILESADAITPTGTINQWFEVAPNYGRVHDISKWSRKDGSAVPFADEGATAQQRAPKPGDRIDFGPVGVEPCNVVRVSVDITVQKLGAGGG